MHKCCYKKYIRPFNSSDNSDVTNENQHSSSHTDDGNEQSCSGIVKNHHPPSSDTNDKTASESEYNFEHVSNYITQNIIGTKESISIADLHEMYSDGHVGDRHWRAKLKDKILKTFNEKITFVSTGSRTPENIISRDALAITNISKQNIVHLAANYIREDILEMSKTVHRKCWPPSIDELEIIEKSTPPSLTSFYNQVLHPGNNHKIPKPTQVLVNSFSSDLLYNVSKGDILPKKHFLLSTGLQSITGC